MTIHHIPSRIELTSGEEHTLFNRFKNSGDKRWPETTRFVQVSPPPGDSVSGNSILIGAIIPESLKRAEFVITAPKEAGLHVIIWRLTFNDEKTGEAFYFGPEIIFNVIVQPKSEPEALEEEEEEKEDKRDEEEEEERKFEKLEKEPIEYLMDLVFDLQKEH